ncbi:MAG TPA: D-alanine--D-alanine ligase [Polyangia bacterium]|jgi:D-alanine-D-alanine ligase|nr:D-alanine--D-alanine ligase [Polyangia bacterium]
MSRPPHSLRITVLHNNDFHAFSPDAHNFASVADVENAAQGIARALLGRGHAVQVVGLDAAEFLSVVASLAADPPDLVFNLCESLAGETRHEPVLPALLDLVGIPYTGSGPEALSLALRKERCKEILQARGIPTPAAVLLDHPAIDEVALPFPLIVKPAWEDASVGIHNDSVVQDRAALAAAVRRTLGELEQPALVEQYVEGREIYVSLLGNPPEALPMHEIDFTDLPAGLPRIVSYDAKWAPESPECVGTRPVRCLIDEPARLRVERVARAAFAALELRDYARIDLRLAPDGTPYVIDINPNCDLSDGAGVSRAAGFAGLDYPSLVERVVWTAWERAHHARSPRARIRPRSLLPLARETHLAGGPATGAGRPAEPGGAGLAGRAVHAR